jgi:hypothetical protein
MIFHDISLEELPLYYYKAKYRLVVLLLLFLFLNLMYFKNNCKKRKKNRMKNGKGLNHATPIIIVVI